MTTYSISFDGQAEAVILVSSNGPNDPNPVNKNIPLNELLMNDGTYATDINNFTRDQSILNYFDSIKDGTNPATLQQLNIYPLAASSSQGYPPYNIGNDKSIHIIEDNILRTRKYNLHRTTWLKLKRGHELDPKKDYNEIMWESGLGHSVFINLLGQVRKTFGSFIDPLSKTAGGVWPLPGVSLNIDESFMRFMGFGNSRITATAIDNDDNYTYNMNIGCGNSCQQPPCILNNNSPVNKYTLGNDNKKNELNKSGNGSEKIKYIVIKEWGDKLQVIIYIMYYFLYASISNIMVAMITCDMVVFITCLNFQALCIYNGALSGERLDLLTEDLSNDQKNALQLEIDKRHYSILEYKPQDKFQESINKIQMTITNINRENSFFIQSIERLIANPDTGITVGSQKYIFKKEFYENCLNDINAINSEMNTDGEDLSNYWTARFGVETNKTDYELDTLYKDLKSFESQHLLVPFIKIKKGTNNKLTLLSTKSYTAQLPCVNRKPSFNNSTETFQVLAIRTYKVNFGGKIMRGGSAIKPEDIDYKTFVQDDDSEYPYIFDLSNEKDLAWYDEKSDIGIDINRVMKNTRYSFDLLKRLNKTFDNTLTKIFKNFEKNEEIKKYFQNNKRSISFFDDGLYTMFVYYSYLNGTGICDFDNNILVKLLHLYDLYDSVDIFTYIFEERGRSINPGSSRSRNNRSRSRSRNNRSRSRSRNNRPRIPNVFAEISNRRSISFGGKKRKTRHITKTPKMQKTRKNKKTHQS